MNIKELVKYLNYISFLIPLLHDERIEVHFY